MFALAAGLMLASCAQAERPSPMASAQATSDDDAFCRSNGGAPGSNGYAACIKEREVARAGQEGRMDRAHQRMADDMLNRR